MEQEPNLQKPIETQPGDQLKLDFENEELLHKDFSSLDYFEKVKRIKIKHEKNIKLTNEESEWNRNDLAEDRETENNRLYYRNH